LLQDVPSPGKWSWSYTSVAGDPASNEYVYVTARDSIGKKDQAVFRLQIGGADTASDHGDPHLRTVDGTRYDFQAAGEFTLLRDREGMEIQVRQTPTETPPPVADGYTGLTECVSLNSAVAARVGSHRLSYQPGRDRGRLEFFVDGEPMAPPKGGLDLDGHRVSTFDAGGETGIRVDYLHGPVLTVTPLHWNSYDIWYLDVNVANTNGDEGLMGRIYPATWLPALPNGATVGPMPASLHQRHVTLYRTFADAWRVTDATSLFTYLPWRDTEWFTDRDWPSEKPPCELKPEFQKPLKPIRKNIGVAKAKRICAEVTDDDLHASCVFDVVTTGDETFARGYLLAQELRRCGTAVQVVSDKPRTRPGEPFVITATVLPLTPGSPVPTGSVTFFVEGVKVGRAVRLDSCGRAVMRTEELKAGEYTIHATYAGGGKHAHHASSSPTLLHAVGAKRRPKTEVTTGLIKGEHHGHTQGQDKAN
jgi:hypothetical protein